MAKHITSRRALLAGAGGMAAAGALSTAALALPAGSEPSSDFYEIRRLAGLAQQVWDSDLDDDTKEAEVGRLEGESSPRFQPTHPAVSYPLDVIEERVMNKQPVSLSDLLDRAAFVLYWSYAGAGGFDQPVKALKLEAEDGDCFESRALLLAAAIFEAAGVGGANV